MKKQPLISIITVVLNGAKTLENAFNSVFSQNFAEYEYIIIDGGSTDGTLDIIKKNEDNIAYWVSGPDNGVYDAMNKAVQFAQGEWICFLGADDILYNVLAEMAGYLVDDRTIYYGDVYRPVLGRKYDGCFSPYQLACRNICHQSIFYPRCVWEKYAFNLKYKVFADHALNMRCFSDPYITMKYIPVLVAVFNDEGGLSPNTKDEAFERDRMKLIGENFSYRVYILARIRFFLIQLLGNLGLIKYATGTLHTIRGVIRKPSGKKE